MSHDGADSPGRLAIGSAADLAAALRHPDLMVRLSVLRALAADPERAMAYGRHDGRDLVDDLLALLDGWGASPLFVAGVACLLALDDPRVLEWCEDQFARMEDPELAALVGERLADLPERRRVELLQPVLMAEGRPAHARISAGLLSDCRLADDACVVRRTLLLGEPASPGDATRLWMDELRGPWWPLARAALEDCGAQTVRALDPHARDMDDDTLTWLLRLAAEHAPDDAPQAMARALGSDDPTQLRAALGCAERAAEPVREPLGSLITPLVHHPDPGVRADAVAAGAAIADVPAALSAEAAPEVRVALLSRLSGNTAALSRVLMDDDWRVRARATELLIAAGSRAEEHVAPLVEGAPPATRLAATQVLIGLGREPWTSQGTASHTT
ncbi:MAG: hypothetical protein GF320_18090 [Armatimonadia bacterium]|nr:hypothetical protein [Armatimonadia bacterium]